MHRLTQQARVAGLQLTALRSRRDDLDRAIAALEEFQRLTTGHIRKLSAERYRHRANSATGGRNRRYRREGKVYVMEAAA